MEIKVIRREIDGIPCSSELPNYTLTVGDGIKKVSVNISRREAERTIDEHDLTGYEPIDSNGFTENWWDNLPPTETSENTES